VLTLLGGAPLGTTSIIDLSTLLDGHHLRGSIQGAGIPQLFLPDLLRLYRAGEFPADRLITQYQFSRIADTVSEMESAMIKPVLAMPT
jgi:aryl-alcohol dehydrogenase